MEENKDILCSASYYKHGYFFNEKFNRLPEQIKRELRVITVCMAERIKGIAILGFYNDSADVYIEVMNQPDDYLYDEIGAKLEVGYVERDNEELLKSLSLWYKTFIKGEVK
ncbi:MAG: DUF6145 family protein [Clostridia bacterium]|nr:DUF6145 family protein [Clostridia bacterium]